MAQRFPADFDGIVSGVPVINWTGLQSAGNRSGIVQQNGGWLDPAKVTMLRKAVNAACDAAQTTPTAAGGTLTFVRAGETGGYSIKPSAASMSIVMFDPRGFANLAASGNFQVKTPNDEVPYRRTICLDAAGRATVRAYTTVCN